MEVVTRWVIKKENLKPINLLRFSSFGLKKMQVRVETFIRNFEFFFEEFYDNLLNWDKIGSTCNILVQVDPIRNTCKMKCKKF